MQETIDNEWPDDYEDVMYRAAQYDAWVEGMEELYALSLLAGNTPATTRPEIILPKRDDLPF